MMRYDWPYMQAPVRLPRDLEDPAAGAGTGL
jgi:hypothetical protein